MGKKRILFVDDEERRMEYYIEELRDQFEVTLATSPAEAWAHFGSSKAPLPPFELVVLDVFMQPTEGFEGAVDPVFENLDPERWLRSGIVLFDKLKTRYPDLPVVVFTNAADARLAEQVRRRAHTRFFRKSDLLPYQLLEEIQKMVTPEAGD